MSYIKCMIIVILTVYLVTISLSDSEFHEVQDYCVFDCFLFNLVTISLSDSEFHKVHNYCVFDSFFIMSPFQMVSYIKYVIIVCFNIFSSILSPFQWVSYMKCIFIVCLTVFSFYFVTISDSELHKMIDYCVFDCFLFLSCHHFSW